MQHLRPNRPYLPSMESAKPDSICRIGGALYVDALSTMQPKTHLPSMAIAQTNRLHRLQTIPCSRLAVIRTQFTRKTRKNHDAHPCWSRSCPTIHYSINTSRAASLTAIWQRTHRAFAHRIKRLHKPLSPTTHAIKKAC